MKKKTGHPPKIPITAGILAGGMSSRMGQDKKFLMWESNTFLDLLAAKCSDFGEILVSVSANQPCRIKEYQMIRDTRTGYGPLEGIYQLLFHARYDRVLVAAVDMPFLSKELFHAMAAQDLNQYDILALVAGNRTHPLCAIYSKALLSGLEKMFLEEHHSVMQLLETSRTKLIQAEELGFSERTLTNVNTIEEYQILTGKEVKNES